MADGLVLPQLHLEKPSKPRRMWHVSPPWWDLPRNETWDSLLQSLHIFPACTHHGQRPEAKWQRAGMGGLQKMLTGSVMMPGN